MARRSILLLVAVLIAALGTTMILLYVRGVDARASEGQEMIGVLTATDVIEAGESVADAQSAGKLEQTQVVRDAMVEGALSSTTTIEDQVSIGTIYPGEQIISLKFGDPGSEETLTIPDDKLAISVELTDPARVAGFVSPGSDVAIFISADPKLMKLDGSTQELPAYTRLLLPKVQVIGVGTTTMAARTTTTDDGEQLVEQIPRTILTVAVDQEQAEKVIYGSRNGDLSFALLSDKSQATDNPGVTALDVLPEAFGGAR